MLYNPSIYDEPVFRPPSEGNSVIVQVTLGCSWNKCAFCEMYTTKIFRAKKDDEILATIKILAKQTPSTRKIFLGDGNAMVLSARKLMYILELLKLHFPKLSRVSAYALPQDIMSKTEQELQQLKNAGLKLIYIGIESGNDVLLKLMNKSETFESTKQGIIKARLAGIKISAMILNGLGGKKYSEQHAIDSARLLNETQPELLSTLVLSFPYELAHFQKRLSEDFIQLNQLELIKEMRTFISETKLNSTIFRSNHASNYLILKGILGKDKVKLLSQMDDFLHNPNLNLLRKEWERGL